MKTIKDDNINPKHYKDNAFGKELIEVMQQTLSKEEFIGYCKGNAIKYRMRAGKKSNKINEDINKALWYEAKLKNYNNLPF